MSDPVLESVLDYEQHNDNFVGSNAELLEAKRILGDAMNELQASGLWCELHTLSTRHKYLCNLAHLRGIL